MHVRRPEHPPIHVLLTARRAVEDHRNGRRDGHHHAVAEVASVKELLSNLVVDLERTEMMSKSQDDLRHVGQLFDHLRARIRLDRLAQLLNLLDELGAQEPEHLLRRRDPTALLFFVTATSDITCCGVSARIIFQTIRDTMIGIRSAAVTVTPLTAPPLPTTFSLCPCRARPRAA